MIAEQVGSRDDLVLFLREMSVQVGSFDNQRLDAFLEAAAGWLADMDGYFENRGETVPTDASWSLIAMALSAATVYD